METLDASVNISDEQLTINRYEEWLHEEQDRLKKFKDSPHDNIKWKKQPTHPKMLLTGEKKKNKKLRGDELQEYLKQHCADGPIGNARWPRIPFEYNRQDITRYLKDGWNVIKRHQSQLLGHYIEYGRYLKKAKRFFIAEKDGSETWEQWLRNNIGITQPYSSKICTVYNTVRGFPRVKTLGISFSKVYDHRQEIKNLLQTNETAANYWRQQP